MTPYTHVDYANAYFPRNPPRIVGMPSFDTLRTLEKAIKANASSVQSDLGGGAHGHLELVLDDATYHNLTGQHYIRPAHPGALNIPNGTALHEAVRLREEHTEAVRLFRETIDVENALI